METVIAIAGDISAAISQPMFLVGLSTVSWLAGVVIVFSAFKLLGLPKERPKLPWFLRRSDAEPEITVWMKELFATGVPFTILGVVIGYLTGVSRSPAVGSVIPAILTLVAGISVFMASDGGRKGALASSAMIFLSFALVVGVSHGSRIRTKALEAENSRTARMGAIAAEVNLRSYQASLEKKANLPPR